MGLGGISIWSLLLILVIVLLIFGTKKLRNLGGDLGGAIKGFKEAMSEGEKKDGGKEDSEQLERSDNASEKPAADRDREHKSS